MENNIDQCELGLPRPKILNENQCPIKESRLNVQKGHTSKTGKKQWK